MKLKLCYYFISRGAYIGGGAIFGMVFVLVSRGLMFGWAYIRGAYIRDFTVSDNIQYLEL